MLTAIAGTAVLALLAWRGLGVGAQNRDRLGSVLVVQLFGLLVSPISWVHHWVWVVPLIIWLFRGCWRDEPGARALGWVWVAVTFLSFPSLLALAEPSLWQISRPRHPPSGGGTPVVVSIRRGNTRATRAQLS